MKKDKNFQIKNKIIQLIPIAGLISFIGLLIYVRHKGLFQTPEDLQAFIHQFGNFAVAAFIIVQAIQPTIPFLPGGIATIVGMLMFGNIMGLVYSYVGLVLGEIILFLLVRRYGMRFVRLILSEKNFEKFNEMLSKRTKEIKKLLILSFIVPFLPDDLVCLVSGMSDMSLKDYVKIIVLLKPWSVITYGYLVMYILKKLPPIGF